MIESINVRFFVMASIGDDFDIVEITESCFVSLSGAIEYERNSVFENGCRQVCLTVHPFDTPEIDSLELA